MAVFYFPDHDCVLIHIPKTGGASIRWGFFEGKFEGPSQGKVPDEWKDKFKFAFVRNPFDRLVSAWKMVSTGMEESKWKGQTREMPFDEFLEIVVDESIPFDSTPRKNTEEVIRHHTVAQTHPYNCLHEADFVGRFENLKSDFAEICKRANLTGELPHMNRTAHDDYRKYYTDASRELVENYFREDLESLNYKFEE